MIILNIVMLANSDSESFLKFFHVWVEFLDGLGGGAVVLGDGLKGVARDDHVVDFAWGGSLSRGSLFYETFVGFVGKGEALRGSADAEIGLVEMEVTGSEGVVGEVEDPFGVEGLVLEAHFEMEVWAGAATGAAAKAYGLAGAYHLFAAYVDFGEVTIDGFEAVVVTDYDEVAVGAHGAGDAYDTGKGCPDGVSGIESDVDATMGSFPTPAIGGGDDVFDGEAEVAVGLDQS